MSTAIPRSQALALQRPSDDSTSTSSTGSRRQRLRAVARRFFSRQRTKAATVPRTGSKHSVIDARAPSTARRASQIDMLIETWEDWTAAYARGAANLSEAARPTCFGGFGYMPPPAHADEAARLRALNRVSSRIDWCGEKPWLLPALNKVLAAFHLKTATVSFVGQTCQCVHASVGLSRDLLVISRDLSLDAHAILSREYFALLDASSDWRSRLNPLVHGPPFVKFYLGVPVVVDGQPIGCVAVFDPYIRSQLSAQLVEQMQVLAARLSAKLEASLRPAADGARRSSRLSLPDTSADPDSFFDACSAHTASTDVCSTTTCDERVHEVPLVDADMTLALARKLHALPARQTVHQPFQVLESLLRCRTVPHAIKKACQVVCRNLGAEIAYVAELRHSRISARAESRARLVGYYIPCERTAGLPPGPRAQAEQAMVGDARLLRAATESQYGVFYSSRSDAESDANPDLEQPPAQPRAGLLVPFRRSEQEDCAPGAFVLAVFVASCRVFSPGDVVFTKKVIKALNNIIACHEETLLAR